MNEIEIAFNKSGISKEILLSKSRKKDVVVKRTYLVYYFRTDLNLTFNQIASIFGRHHATIIHMYKIFRDMCSIYPIYKNNYYEFRNKLPTKKVDFKNILIPSRRDENKELLCDFFFFFRNNGEKLIENTIEGLVDIYLDTKTNEQ